MIERIETAITPHRLCIMGGFHTGPRDLDGAPGTLIMLGPTPKFWLHFKQSSEYHDKQPNPLDRWSERIITVLANDLHAKPLFPFGGPPYQPFIDWAKRTGRTFSSPTGLLIHDTYGLMTSYRGALWVHEILTLPETGPSPCENCAEKPCLSACPVDAFSSGSYDVPACKTDLTSPTNTCLSQGCSVRRACPVSTGAQRAEEQSAFHMRAFLGPSIAP